MKLETRRSWLAPICLLTFAFCLLTSFFILIRLPSGVEAQGNPLVRGPTYSYLIYNPTITIAGAPATSATQSTPGVSQAHIEFNFGTVAGSYGTCTVQAKTSYDGVNFLNLGTAASVTATTGTLNAWDICAQAANSGTLAVTVGAVSAAAALGFGQLTEYTFACSSYGTSAPATIRAIYR